jgi:hypothetical protein
MFGLEFWTKLKPEPDQGCQTFLYSKPKVKKNHQSLPQNRSNDPKNAKCTNQMK